jgi:hypothetical protein
MPHARLFRLAIAPIAIAAAIGLAACGGDDEDTIPLADWIAQADEICREGDADLDQEIRDFFGGDVPDQPNPDQLADLATAVIAPNFQSQHDEIADLPEPEEESGKVDETLDALQEGVDQLEEDPSVIATEEGPEGIQEASRLAGELGLEECGQ